MNRVKCANCGTIWDYFCCPSVTHIGDQRVLDNMMAAHQTKCPKCGSNAYDVIGSSVVTSNSTNPPSAGKESQNDSKEK